MALSSMAWLWKLHSITSAIVYYTDTPVTVWEGSTEGYEYQSEITGSFLEPGYHCICVLIYVCMHACVCVSLKELYYFSVPRDFVVDRILKWPPRDAVPQCLEPADVMS